MHYLQQKLLFFSLLSQDTEAFEHGASQKNFHPVMLGEY